MNLEEFRTYAQTNNVIPVYRKLLADGETPLGVYRKLAQSKLPKPKQMVQQYL
jgi:anthranilate synthase component 1